MRLAGRGRNRETVVKDDQFIVTSVLRTLTSEVKMELQEVQEVTGSTKTLRRTLKSAGIISYLFAREQSLLATCLEQLELILSVITIKLGVTFFSQMSSDFV